MREKERMAETEAVFREMNEQVARTAERFEVTEPEFYCECADPSCHGHLEAPRHEYERVRARGTRFLVLPGHVQAGLERVIERRAGYAVIEKFDPTMARIVRRLDPRTQPA